jgi:uncharacterized protein (DUF433 family)
MPGIPTRIVSNHACHSAGLLRGEARAIDSASPSIRHNQEPSHRRPRGELDRRLEKHEMRSMVDWTKCPDVESIPGKLSGAWCVKGRRVPVTVILYYAADASAAEIAEMFELDVETVRRILDYARTNFRT